MLPKALANYYSANSNAFWVRRLNTVLKEIERLGVRPERLDRFPIPNPSIPTFQPNKDCRFIRDITQNDRPVHFEMRGSYATIVDDNWTPQAGTVWTSNPASNTMHSGSGYFTIAATSANASVAVGKMIRLQGVDDDGFDIDWSALIATITGGPTSWNVTVDVPYLPSITTFSTNVYDDFLITMGDRKLNVVSATQPIPLDDEWESLLIAGLRYYGEIQLDETSNNTKVWMYEYEKAKKDYVKAGAQVRGQVGSIKRHFNPRYGSLR